MARGCESFSSNLQMVVGPPLRNILVYIAKDQSNKINITHFSRDRIQGAKYVYYLVIVRCKTCIDSEMLNGGCIQCYMYLYSYRLIEKLEQACTPPVIRWYRFNSMTLISHMRVALFIFTRQVLITELVSHLILLCQAITLINPEVKPWIGQI